MLSYELSVHLHIVTKQNLTQEKKLKQWLELSWGKPFHPHEEILLFLFYQLLKSANFTNLFSYPFKY